MPFVDLGGKLITLRDKKMIKFAKEEKVDFIGVSFVESSKHINLIRKVMYECKSVGEKIGIRFRISVEDRINGAISIKGHKPSTTQDIELKKSLEIDPIIGSVIEIGNRLKVKTDNLKLIYNLLKFKGELMGIYTRNDQIDKITN